MAWPTNPTNGQQVTIANVLYQYSSSTGAWNKVQLTAPTYLANGNTVTVQNNLTAPGLVTVGSFSSTGNITGSYLFGNGSQISGLPANYGNANVANYLPTYNGYLTGGNLSTTGNISGYNVNAAGFITAQGNITGGNIVGSYVYGNGSQLTGITASLAGTVSSANVTYVAPYSSSVSRTGNSKWSDEVSVKDFGATGNGTTDDGPAFQLAVNALGNKGGTIIIPPGTYLINTQVVISNLYGAVTFEGYGWGDFYGPYANPSPAPAAGGTKLKTTNSSSSPFSITAGANGVRFRYLSCLESHPTPGPGWSPTAYQPFFNVQADGFELDHVFFFGINKGVVVGQVGTAVGRASFTHVWGEFFTYGINIVFAADVCRIDHMHVWPFWSQATNNDVLVYTSTNTKAISTYRCDNPQFSNIFTYACHNAIYIGSTVDGTTSKMLVSNMDADATDTGIQIDADNVTLAVNNYSSQPGPNALVGSTSRSLFVQASGCNIQITNFRSARTNAESVYVGGNYNNVGIVNYDVNHWSDAGGSYGAISSAATTNAITLAGKIVFGPTSYGTQFGGTLGSINWPNATKGTNVASTNGSGNVVVTHGLSQSPNEVYCQLRQPSAYILTVTAISATTFTVTVLNSTNGATVNNTQVLFNWQTDM